MLAARAEGRDPCVSGAGGPVISGSGLAVLVWPGVLLLGEDGLYGGRVSADGLGSIWVRGRRPVSSADEGGGLESPSRVV